LQEVGHDTNALLDLLAALEDGFSFVEKVSTQRQSSAGNESRVGGEFGISNVLSLLRIGVRGDAASRRSDEESHNVESERTHTYGSLLHRLRARLEADGQVRPVTSVGDFAQVDVFDWALGQIYRSSHHRADALTYWLHHYNEQRPHSARSADAHRSAAYPTYRGRTARLSPDAGLAKQ
jgi:transposase InsO family protein